MMTRKSILVSLLCALFVSGPAQQLTAAEPVSTSAETTYIIESNGVLTLEDVLALTVMHNPELKVFSLETQAASSRQLQSGLWPNPMLEVEIEDFGGTGESSGFKTSETTFKLSQIIELGNKSQKRERVASFETELAGIDYRSKKLEVFSKAAKAFILVLKAQEKLNLSNELLKLSKNTFNTVEKRVSAGKDSPVERTRASVALANNKISHRKIRRNLEYAKKYLASFWGQKNLVFSSKTGNPTTFDRATGSLDIVERLPLLEDLAVQLKLSPDYTRWESEIKKSQAALSLEKSKAIGNIKIAAGMKRIKEIDENLFLFSVMIPLPLSDRNQGAKQAAMYNVSKSREAQRLAWLKLQSEFYKTYQSFVDSYSQAMSLKNEVLPGATDMFEAAERAYKEGKVDYLNVLDAQRTLFGVKNDYIENLAAYHIAKTEIERFVSSDIGNIN